jgi:HEPN domain-containing protein
MKKQAKSWLEAAYDDILVIENIKSIAHLTHMVSFHAQQSIEKSFKSILEENEEIVPKTHNLIVLMQKIEKYINKKIDDSIIAQLNELYIESRYPADLGLLPEGKPTINDAERFYSYALEIYEIASKIENNNSV